MQQVKTFALKKIIIFSIYLVNTVLEGSIKHSTEHKPQSVNSYPDRAPLKEVLGGQYNYREEGRRQGTKGRRRSRSCQCSKDPCAQKVSGGRTDPSPKYRW